jgi:hypothetical protein
MTGTIRALMLFGTEVLRTHDKLKSRTKQRDQATDDFIMHRYA